MKKIFLFILLIYAIGIYAQPVSSGLVKKDTLTLLTTLSKFRADSVRMNDSLANMNLRKVAYADSLSKYVTPTQTGVISIASFGGANDSIQVANALTSIGSNATTLLFTPKTWHEGYQTFPSNVTLQFTNGAILNDSCVIKGSVQAGLYQIFSTVQNLDSAKIKEVYPEWWGAKGDWDGTTGTDNTNLIQNALYSISRSNKTLSIQNGIYLITKALIVTPDISIIGSKNATLYATKSVAQGGSMRTTTIAGLNIMCFLYLPFSTDSTLSADNVTIENLTFESDCPFQTTTAGQSTYYTYGTKGIMIMASNTKVINCSFFNIYQEAIQTYNPPNTSSFGSNQLWEGNYFYQCNFDCMNVYPGSYAKIINNTILDCGYGIEASPGGNTITEGFQSSLIIMGNSMTGILVEGIRIPSADRNAGSGIIISGNTISGDLINHIYPLTGINVTFYGESINISNNIVRYYNTFGIGISTSGQSIVESKIQIIGNQILDCINTTSHNYASAITLNQGVEPFADIKNIDISHNIIDNDYAYPTLNATYQCYYGIWLNSFKGHELKNLTIDNNLINHTIQGIYAENNYFSSNLNITNNSIDSSGRSGITIASSDANAKGIIKISGNTIRNTLGTYTGAYPAADIYIYQLNWARVEGNSCNSPALYYDIYIQSCQDVLELNNIILSNSSIAWVSDVGQYHSLINGNATNAFPTKITSTSNGSYPTSGRFSHGSVCYDQTATGDGNKWTCISPVSSLGWGYTGGTSTTGSIVSGNDTLTVADSTGWEVNDAIQINGAGSGASNLQTKVMTISGKVLTVNTNASTTVSSVSILHIPCVWQGDSVLNQSLAYDSLGYLRSSILFQYNGSLWLENDHKLFLGDDHQVYLTNSAYIMIYDPTNTTAYADFGRDGANNLMINASDAGSTIIRGGSGGRNDITIQNQRITFADSATFKKGIISNNFIFPGSVAGGSAMAIDSVIYGSADTSITTYYHAGATAHSMKVQNGGRITVNDLSDYWFILLGVLLPFVYSNRKRFMKLFLIIFVLISVSTFAQSKQDSVNVQQKQYQFQIEVQKEQQLESELNVQKIKAFDAWKEWQIAAQPFQQAIEQKKK